MNLFLKLDNELAKIQMNNPEIYINAKNWYKFQDDYFNYCIENLPFTQNYYLSDVIKFMSSNLSHPIYPYIKFIIDDGVKEDYIIVKEIN